jgi:hypothetical protein
LRDFEKTKCRAGGRRFRTACKTISPADADDFRAGKTVQYLLGERAADLQTAWGTPVDGSIESVHQQSGLTREDLAELHMSAMVPICLNVEAGRHTCHPEEKPGREFYEVSRLFLIDHIRAGRIRWRGLPRGGGAGDVLPGGGVHERIDCGPGGLHEGTEACRGVPANSDGSAPGAPGSSNRNAPGGNRPLPAGIGGGMLALVAVVLLALSKRG